MKNIQQVVYLHFRSNVIVNEPEPAIPTSLKKELFKYVKDKPVLASLGKLLHNSNYKQFTALK